MNIGKASQITRLPAKTIRYYEEIGLVMPARAVNGYRDYDDKDIHRLAFLQRSRSLGFTIEQCRSLLSLYENKNRSSSDVKELAIEKISEIDRKIIELKSLRNTLEILVEHCRGDDKPDCPIIEEIAKGPRG